MLQLEELHIRGATQSVAVVQEVLQALPVQT
jgi:hypothetical protein